MPHLQQVLADKAYSSRSIREHLANRGIKAVIPIKDDQAAARARKGSRGGRPPAFDTARYRQRNTVNPSGINGQSVYNGTDGVDRIYGGNDNDTFWGGKGNDIIGKMKILAVLESLPGVGKVKARKIMDEIGIADSRRVQGLGAQQRIALLEKLGRDLQFGRPRLHERQRRPLQRARSEASR